MALTKKQKLFVEEYLIDLNATQAAIRAGYSPETANEQGSRMLANVSIRNEIEKRILSLGEDPYIGTDPRYLVLKRQGYKILILDKDLVFYKIDEDNKNVVVYAVVDQRQDYLNIIRGL